ncbi:MAG: nuclear transport factor 2 family protein [Chitinophagaceae bacterium]|nr:nuclear transport factor 2 family protein [Chitinophagaceae bacterium]
MKQFLLIITCIAFISISLNAQNNTAEQAVSKTLQQLHNALAKSDAAILEKIFADTYFFSDPGGVTHNKKDMVEYAKGGNFKVESSIPSDKKITVYGNTAIITEHATEKGHVGDEDIAGEYRWIFILHKEGNEWKIVSMQGTKIIKP